MILRKASEDFITDKKNKPNKVRKTRVVFVCIMLFFPAVHFFIFNVCIGFESLYLCFQKYNFQTAKYEWAGLYNFIRVYDELTKGVETTVLVHSIINSLEYYVVQTFIFLPVSIFCAFFFGERCRGIAYSE